MPDTLAVRLAITSEDGGTDERVVDLPVAFGRDPERADVVLSDRMVSRRHARLEADGDGVVLVDLDSANGTWIGDDRVERRPLEPDDVVTLGAHTVRWGRVETTPAPAPTPATPRPAPSFGSAGGVVLGPNGLRFLPLADLHATWDAADRRLGEITEALARDGAAADASARLDAHERCAADIDALADAELDALAGPTLSLCAPEVDVGRFRAGLAALRALPAHRAARPARDTLGDGAVETLLEADRRLVDALDAALGDGLDAFSEHGPDVVRLAAPRLVGALRGVLAALTESDARRAEHLGRVATG
jgi:hypothetical protein